MVENCSTAYIIFINIVLGASCIVLLVANDLIWSIKQIKWPLNRLRVFPISRLPYSILWPSKFESIYFYVNSRGFPLLTVYWLFGIDRTRNGRMLSHSLLHQLHVQHFRLIIRTVNCSMRPKHWFDVYTRTKNPKANNTAFSTKFQTV